MSHTTARNGTFGGAEVAATIQTQEPSQQPVTHLQRGHLSDQSPRAARRHLPQPLVPWHRQMILWHAQGVIVMMTAEDVVNLDAGCYDSFTTQEVELEAFMHGACECAQAAKEAGKR